GSSDLLCTTGLWERDGARALALTRRVVFGDGEVGVELVVELPVVDAYLLGHRPGALFVAFVDAPVLLFEVLELVDGVLGVGVPRSDLVVEVAGRRRVGHGYQRGFELVEGGGAVSQCPRVALIGVRSLVRRLDGGLDPGLRGLGTTTGPRALQHGQRPTTTITDLDVAFGQLLRDLDTALPSGRVTGLDLAHKLGQRHGYPKKFVRLSENVRTPHHRPARSFRFSTNNSAISCAKSHGSSSPILARLGFAA